MRRRFALSLAAILMTAGALTSISFAQASEVVGQASVIDGDTLDIGGQRIRLDAIDAPESTQWCLDHAHRGYRCGQHAALALAEKIGRKHVRCRVVGYDRYQRALARCELDRVDLNAWMVRQGHALAYRHYSDAYIAAENSARAERNGIWQGKFDPPWEWRNGEPSIGDGGILLVRGSGRKCAIKGNINRKGERIYHSPGQQFYGRTQIDESRGERWFCSAAEAEAAGWRAAKR